MNHKDETAEEGIVSVMRKHVRVPFGKDSLLAEVGLDSLSVLRIAVDVVPDQDHEIDLADLAGVRTIGDLQLWLRGLLVPVESAR